MGNPFSNVFRSNRKHTVLTTNGTVNVRTDGDSDDAHRLAETETGGYALDSRRHGPDANNLSEGGMNY